MEIKKRVLKVIYDGQEYNLAHPSIKVLKEYQTQFKSMQDDESKALETSQNLLARLGLPIEVSDEMEAGDLAEIMQVLTGQKKI
jgi:hypothetical protein